MIVLIPSGANTLVVNVKKWLTFSERGAFNEIPRISLLVEQEKLKKSNIRINIFFI